MMMEMLPMVAEGAAGAANATSQPSMWGFLLPVLVVLVVMTFISGRSQKKQREKQRKMFDSIVKGSKVRTIGGFTAKVVEVKADTLMIELAEKLPPVELAKNAVASVIDEQAAGSADTAKK